MDAPPSDWIEKIIRIDSTTFRSNDEIVSFLVPLLQESGLKVREQRVVEDGTVFKNLVAFNQAPDAPGLLALHTHLDTVTPGEASAWTKTHSDPFKATRVRDRVYGLGTADVKLDFLCKLVAIRSARPSRPVALVGSYGEERGLIGAMKLVEAREVKPRFALVGEPSNLELIYAHKGHVVCTVSVPLPAAAEIGRERSWRGRAVHSSTPELGRNALVKGLTEIFKRGYGITRLEAGADANKVPDLCRAWLFERPNEATRAVFALTELLETTAKDLKRRRDSRFSPATSTVSLNRAQSRDGKLFLTFDVRTLPDVDQERFKARLVPGLERCGVTIESLTMDPPLKGRRESPFLRELADALKAAGVKKVSRATKASSTEAAVYNRAGAEAVVFGPGISIGNVHRPNEYNLISHLEVATRFYTAMLRSPVGKG